MIRRTEPTPLPTDHHRFRVRFTNGEEAVLRLPPHSLRAKISRDLGRARKQAEAAPDKAEAAAVMADAATGAAGALVGFAWADPAWELEQRLGLHSDSLAFGRAVMDELESWGCMVSEATALADRLSDAIVKILAPDIMAGEVADFFAPMPREGGDSSICGPAQSTAATLMRSTG